MLVAGAPGTGKTSLGMQFIHSGITRFQEPGIFITFEEFPERIYRDATSFGWDFRALEDQGKLKVLFTSPEVLQQDIVRDHGLVNEMIAEIRAMRVVVDSVTNLHNAGQDPRQFRDAVYSLVNALKRESLTAMLLRELREHEDIGSGPEEFLADGLIMLTRSYVADRHMRFIEVVKSRGSPHIPIPSLFTIGEGGLRVLPPFQEPFYRFEEAVSTGIPQLDDLLGGGIPYGGVYLMEVDADTHQDIFDVGFAKEALEAGDFFVRVAGDSRQRSRWRALMKEAGVEKSLQKGLDSGRVTLLWAGGRDDTEQASSQALGEEINRACAQASGGNLRIQADLSRLFALLPPEQAHALFSSLTALCQDTKTVVLGVVSPRTVPPQQLAKLRTAADGLVRVWTEGNYSYLQVLKTVNSARTPAYATIQTPRPPFIEIVRR